MIWFVIIASFSVFILYTIGHVISKTRLKKFQIILDEKWPKVPFYIILYSLFNRIYGFIFNKKT